MLEVFVQHSLTCLQIIIGHIQEPISYWNNCFDHIKSLWSQTKIDTGLFKDIEIEIEGREPEPQIQYKLSQESIGPVSDIVHKFLQHGIIKKAQSVVNNC